MDLFILILTFVANLLLGLIVVMRDPKSGLARSFGLMCLFINAWILTNYITNHPVEGNIFVNDIANRLAFASGYAVMMSGLVFTYFFPKRRPYKQSWAVVSSMIWALALVLSATDLVSGRVIIDSHGMLSYSVGPLLWLYILGFIGLLALIAKNLIDVSGIEEPSKRRQSRYVLVAFCSSALIALFLNAVVPLLFSEWHTTRFGPLVTVILVGMIAYSIVKHRLFDIRFAVVRTITYAGVLVTLSAIYYLIAYLLSVIVLGGRVTESISVSPVNIFLALLLAFLFQPIKRFFDRITNDIFYRDRYRSEDFFAELGSLLASTTDLRGLLERASEQIGTTFKADQAFFFLYYSNGINHHMSAGTKGHKKLPVYDARMLDAFTANKNDAVILTESLPEDSTVRRMLVSHKIGLVMPLKRESTVVGYLLLGDQMSEGYKTRDVRVLMTVADELVIAIQNALSLHEIKEINSTLQQRIDSATKELRSSNSQLRHLDEVKDEFISMASHQLRTPLTSVKGYISMMLEGDTGQISPQQRKALEEAFNSSERMVRLISDFLNVSRLQTGKFVIDKAPTDIARIVKTEVDSLRVIAATHDLKLVFHPPKDLPTMDLDEGKVRQVIMNFIDNAIYYSRTKSNVTIKLERIEDDVAFTVTDTGIGVPADEQPKLFNKFFRAKNARQQRPDGTGVGLYLARKVVTAHGGKIVFNSVENVGSTFGFRIPINQLKK